MSSKHKLFASLVFTINGTHFSYEEKVKREIASPSAVSQASILLVTHINHVSTADCFPFSYCKPRQIYNYIFVPYMQLCTN